MNDTTRANALERGLRRRTYVETSTRSESESVVVVSARVARSVDVCRPATSPPAAPAPTAATRRRRRREVEKASVRSRAREDAIVVVKV